MILQRLYELAMRPGERILDDTSFEEQPVPYVVQLGKDGKYLGIQQRRGTVELLSKKKGAPPKIVPDRGVMLSFPRPLGSANAQGAARYFADTLPRVLPVTVEEKDREKSARSRATFWEQLDRAADETNDDALRAVQAFGRAWQSDKALAGEITADVEKLKAALTDRCTFAWDPDLGKTILDREPVRQWFRDMYQQWTGAKQEAGPQGLCQITGQVGPIPLSHAIKLSGVPGGLPTGVSVVSYDKSAFESYALDGAANAGIGYAAADGYLRAADALIKNKLRGNPRTSLKVGDVLFLFWTREPADTNFVMTLDNPEPAQVEAIFHAVRAGKKDALTADPNLFYLLGLSGNSARAIVRDYLETPLPRVWDNLAKWFCDITIADATKDGQGKPSYRYPLAYLAVSTALDFGSMAPETQTTLLHAAFTGGPVPESLLVACLRRLRAEGSSGFRPTRMALIKLILTRREVSVSETLSADERHPAYVYGRLLAVFEQIQYAALGDVNANVVDRFYGRFSTAPYLVLRRLIDGALEHLKKLRGERPGYAVNLDRLLTEVLALAPAAPLKGQMTLEEQARFSLGYYHQKAKQMEERAERKQQAAAKAAQA